MFRLITDDMVSHKFAKYNFQNDKLYYFYDEDYHEVITSCKIHYANTTHSNYLCKFPFKQYIDDNSNILAISCNFISNINIYKYLDKYLICATNRHKEFTLEFSDYELINEQVICICTPKIQYPTNYNESVKLIPLQNLFLYVNNMLPELPVTYCDDDVSYGKNKFDKLLTDDVICKYNVFSILCSLWINGTTNNRNYVFITYFGVTSHCVTLGVLINISTSDIDKKIGLDYLINIVKNLLPYKSIFDIELKLNKWNT